MGIVGDLVLMVSELVRFLRDPDAYQKEKMRVPEDMRERARKELEEQYGDLTLLSPEGYKKAIQLAFRCP
jgi:hypothetical protein